MNSIAKPLDHKPLDHKPFDHTPLHHMPSDDHLPCEYDTMTVAPTTYRATFAIGDEQTAKRVADFLTESFAEGEAAISAFEGPQGRWDITVHFAEPPDQGAIRELVGLAAGEEIAQAVSFDTVEAKDWVKATLEGLVPVRAGRFIVHGRHDRARIPPNKLGIEIEAALAFGTGHHGTTRGCLLLLDSVLKAHRPRRVLDLGTGTGVLAIAAAKALRRKVLASDIDSLSVRIAIENARLNGASDLVEMIRAGGFSAPAFRRRGPFDLVLANILANPLRQMATPMSAHLAPGALIILSGLLPVQAGAVIADYRARGLVLKRHIQLEGWSSLLMGTGGLKPIREASAREQ
jgi:ribosomal protein L11 methyltransferase